MPIGLRTPAPRVTGYPSVLEPPATSEVSLELLFVATLNLRAVFDRWGERLPLLLADMAALQPDLLGLQEVVYPVQQDRLLAAAGPGRYEVVRGWAGRPEFGNSLLIRQPLAVERVDRLDLGLDRAAHRALVACPGGAHVACCVTHLHHPPDASGARLEQVERLLAWLGDARSGAATIVVGDFNASPDEPAYARMVAAGFRSAFREANGAEPPVTWPSGLAAPAIDTDGAPACLDYVWLRGEVRVRSATLVFDRPAVDDPGLYPSDHVGIGASVELP
jgi:endonuclease/exonuclease/phosphatase family metal-dependent hydrolase